MKRFLMALILVAVLSVMPASSVSAATDTVAVTATGEYVGFSNAPATEALGLVSLSSTVWANGSTPGGPNLEDGDCTFTVTNTSSVVTSTTINTADWVGGADWICSDTATPGADTFGMKAGASGDAIASMVIVKKTAAFETLKTDLAALTSFKWEFQLLAPTSLSDGAEKSGTITLTMTAS